MKIYAKNNTISVKSGSKVYFQKKALILTAYFKTEMMRNHNDFMLEVFHINQTVFP